MTCDGRPDAQVLFEQHRQIEQLIGEIEELFSEGVKDHSLVADRVRRLCCLLPEHFRIEEEGGYFSEAVLVAPRLVERAKVLQSQHRLLIELLRSLCTQISSDQFNIQNRWAVAEAAFLRFRQEISRHEQQENLLLQEAFLADLGAKD